MKPVGLTSVNHLNLVVEMQEVGSEQRRGNKSCHSVTLLLVQAVSLRLCHAIGAGELFDKFERLLARCHFFTSKNVHRLLRFMSFIIETQPSAFYYIT
jgi:hypothetical protein